MSTSSCVIFVLPGLQAVQRPASCNCCADNVQAAAAAEWPFNTLNTRTALVLYNETHPRSGCSADTSKPASRNWAAGWWRLCLTLWTTLRRRSASSRVDEHCDHSCGGDQRPGIQ